MTQPAEAGYYQRGYKLHANGGSAMYDYRRMTKEEQTQVVLERRAKGFPWHRPPHPKGAEGWYFITAACYEHAHHFAAANELTALQRRLFEAFGEVESECGGWVVMPNHYHALVTVSGFDKFGKASQSSRAQLALCQPARPNARSTSVVQVLRSGDS